MPQAPGPAGTRFGFLNLLVIALSIYVLVALAVSTLITLPPQTAHLLDLVDDGICLLFLAEFFVRFLRADSKLKFLRWGWVDLVASIPTVAYLRWGRTLRLIRLLRVLRAFRSVRHLIGHLFYSRKQGTFFSVVIITVLLSIFASIAILQVEHDRHSNIRTGEEALWWAYSTITAAGYGDYFPVTSAGRLIAALLMSMGVVVYGTLAGFLASWFGDEKTDEAEADPPA